MNNLHNEIWKPSTERIEKTQMFHFMKFVNKELSLSLGNYADLHVFSVNNSKDFWILIIKFFNIKCSGSFDMLKNYLEFDTYNWFPELKLNFAENLLQTSHFEKSKHKCALKFMHESGAQEEVSYRDLKKRVFKLQSFLKNYISKGDVLAAYMPNIPATVEAMLACTSLGGVFTSTSSDFGIEGVLDRFGQSHPKVLIAAVSYSYNGKVFDQLQKIKEITDKIPSIEKLILVNFLNDSASKLQVQEINSIQADKAICLSQIYSTEIAEIEKFKLYFEPMNFSDPVYIMYSSGTTGKPKCIVHSIGGTLLQHVKELGLHTDLNSDKDIFYFTTCGWMMWNWLISSLFFGTTVGLYEGSPAKPSLEGFFRRVLLEGFSIFGTSPKFLKALEDSGFKYESENEFLKLETLLSTGAPLLEEQFDFVYKNIKSDVQLSSICGGTDIIGCFMLGNPILPVRKGEIQCLGLGMDVACYNEKGEEVIGEEGELVCKKSFPSRPIYFLDDEDKRKINKAYFNRFANVWHHGDFILINQSKIDQSKSVQVLGRSDATLNPGGVRIGTAEIYRQTDTLKYLEDALCVGKQHDGDVDVILFVLLKNAAVLSAEQIKEIKQKIKAGTTPRHIPKYVKAVSGIPYTRSGKKMELAITRLINAKELTNIEAVANPEVLEQYKYILSSEYS